MNGTCYATSTDEHSPDYNHLIYGADFMTGGLLIIPLGVKPSHHVTFEPDASPLSLVEFSSKLFATVGRPVAYVGIAECASLHGTAIGKPPVDGKPIFDFRAEYFPNPETHATNVAALVMGVVSDYREPSLREVHAQLEAVLYRNPFDSGSALSMHVHALGLKRPVSRTEDIVPALADRAMHLFANGTAFRSIRVDAFTIDCLVNVQD